MVGGHGSESAPDSPGSYLTPGDRRVRMDINEGSTELLECDACGNVGLGQGEITCCGGAMQTLAQADHGVGVPSLDDLLRTVFDMSDTELDVCLCVMEGGEQTVGGLADRIDYDRSVVARHLNHLVELGVIEKRRRLLEEGGHAYVYSPRDPAVVRRRFRELFFQWVQEATGLVEELRREKVESIVEADAENPQWRVYLEE